MGIFTKKATDVAIAYESKQSSGMCLVLSDKRNRYFLTHYDIHKPAIMNIVKRFEKAAGSDSAGVTVPVLVRLDLKSSYQPSLGVYFDKIQVGWIPKDDAAEIVKLIKSDGRLGVGILGELCLNRGDKNREVILNKLYIYA